MTVVATARANEAAVYSQEEETATPVVPVSVGDVLCTGGTTVPAKRLSKSGKTACGVVFHVDESGQHGWALALRSEGVQAWGEEVDIEAIPNTNENEALADFNGKGNTAAILAMEGSFPAVQKIDTDAGWYLPSAGSCAG